VLRATCASTGNRLCFGIYCSSGYHYMHEHPDAGCPPGSFHADVGIGKQEADEPPAPKRARGFPRTGPLSLSPFRVASLQSSVVSAGSCIPQGVKQDIAHANAVCRGVVTKVKELAERKETERPRYAVTFSIWYGWLDVLLSRTHFLTVNNFCHSTAEVKQAGKALRALGNGRTPHS
jgi:hypothetical protein